MVLTVVLSVVSVVVFGGEVVFGGAVVSISLVCDQFVHCSSLRPPYGLASDNAKVAAKIALNCMLYVCCDVFTNGWYPDLNECEAKSIRVSKMND